MNKKLQLQQEYGDNKQKDQQQLQVHQQPATSGKPTTAGRECEIIWGLGG